MKDIFIELWGLHIFYSFPRGPFKYGIIFITYLGIPIEYGYNALSFKMKARKY